ncbi:SPOR domain-containing protein [Alphaproteobacteria bacterium]|nr:SPOR domain-containing protein [Alphaproteobacteria bacterium]
MYLKELKSINLKLILIFLCSFTLSNCANINKDIESIITGKNYSGLPAAKDGGESNNELEQLKEKILAMENDISNLKNQIEYLRPNVLELKAIDEEIKNLLSALAKSSSKDKKNIESINKNLNDNNDNKENINNNINKQPDADSKKNKPISLVPTINKVTDSKKQIGIHLASFKSLAAAKKGWEDILNNQKDILTGLDYKISKVELSNNKGTYYRLKAGPYISRESAKESCKFLKAKKLYCKISDFQGLE